MIGYHRPETLEQALAIRSENDVTVLAGGTDVFPARTALAAWGTPARKDVLDLSAIVDLRGIMERRDHWRIGALTTWSDLARTALPPLFDGYRAAAREVGGLQVQNRGTLAGNLCTASPAGDGIPCLLALNASVELTSRAGRRTLPIADFIEGYRQTALRPDELLTAILVPQTPATGGFAKLGARRYLVISIVMVSAVVAFAEDGTVASARVAVGACGPKATRLPALETALAGASLSEFVVDPDLLGPLSPMDDIRASADYRRDAARQLIEDCLHAIGTGARR